LEISQQPNEYFVNNTNIAAKAERPTTNTENVPRDTIVDKDEAE